VGTYRVSISIVCTVPSVVHTFHTTVPLPWTAKPVASPFSIIGFSQSFMSPTKSSTSSGVIEIDVPVSQMIGKTSFLSMPASYKSLWVHESRGIPFAVHCRCMVTFEIVETASRHMERRTGLDLHWVGQVEDRCYRFQLSDIDGVTPRNRSCIRSY